MKKFLDSKLYILIAFVHTLFTFLSDRIFFQYQFNFVVFFYKILLMFVLTLFYKFLFYVGKKILVKDKRIFRNIKIFLVYFFIMFIFFLICYPGNFKNDEMSILEAVKFLSRDSWYHVLTYYLCILSLMIIPLVGGISLIQSFVCSLIFTYIYDKVMVGKKETLLSCLLFIPFLLLPVISSNLYPYRPTMYAYFEVFLIFYLYYQYHNKEKIDWKFFVIVGVFTAILASFRSESIYYLICLPIGIILFFIRNRKEYLIGLLFMIALTIGVYGFLSYDQKRSTIRNENVYSTLTYVLPLSTMLNEDLKGDNLEENLEIIDKVLNIEQMKVCASYKDADPVWKCGALRGSSNDEDYEKAFKSFLEIVKDNPGLFLESRMKTFLATSALDKDASNMIYDTSILFDENVNQQYISYPSFGSDYKFNKPIFKNLRRSTIRFIEGRNIDNYFEYEWTYPVFYNLIIPFLFLGLYVLYNLIKRNWFNSLLFMLPFVRIILIFLTAPACYFMYYFSIYWISMILMGIVVFEYLYKKRYQK